VWAWLIACTSGASQYVDHFLVPLLSYETTSVATGRLGEAAGFSGEPLVFEHEVHFILLWP
jgi:hypothetical protein